MDKLIRISMVAAALLLVWYIVADRVTPFTFNARVKAVVTPIVPRVEGVVIEVNAINSKPIDMGELLVQIDPRPYELVLQKRKAELEVVFQEVGVSSAEVERAQAQLTRATTNLDNMRQQTGRIFELERKALVAKSMADDARTKLADAVSSVSVASADLEAAKNRLGLTGNDNPKVQASLANLADAELQLSYTQLLAPSSGGVVNLDIAVGTHAQVGKPLMTFIDGKDIWIEAYMSENNIGNITAGNSVDVLLDTHPGRVFEGKVESIVSAAYLDDKGANGLPNPPTITKWLREPQLFPVRITLTGYQEADASDDVKLFVNGQADVLIYTSENFLMNALGTIYMRIASLFSYLY